MSQVQETLRVMEAVKGESLSVHNDKQVGEKSHR